MSNMTKEQLFDHYINNPEYVKKEKKFTVLFLFFVIVPYIFSAYFHYVSFPAGATEGGIPYICLYFWCLMVLQYFVVTVFGGGWVCNLKQEKEMGLE